MSQDRTLYLVATGAPLTSQIHHGVTEARARGWTPLVLATQAAEQWLDQKELKAVGVPIQNGDRSPDTPKSRPEADAVIVAPATFNTINKLASGIADTPILSTLCSAIGTRTPMIIVPFVNAKLAGHPAWLASLAVLRYAGTSLIDPQDGAINSHEPIESGTGEAVADAFDWSWPFDQLDKIIANES